MTSRPIRIGLAGASGRMGRAVSSIIAGRDDVELCGVVNRPGLAGAAGLAAVANAEVVIDFTTAQASADLAGLAAAQGRPALVIGSTGFTAEAETLIRHAAERIAIVKSGNFSLGVNVLIGLVRQTSRALPGVDYDVEILETHHRRKIDAPSGTALMLGQAAAQGREVALETVIAPDRNGITAERPTGAIGFASLRGGGVVGEHSVMFAAEDELIILSHSARDRTLFARGAVQAAIWAAGRPPGLYDMQDVLGFARGD